VGALSGGMTVRRMIADGPPAPGFRERYIDSLNAYAIRPLTAESEEDRVAGWATVAHPLDARFEYEKVFFNEYLCVAFRVDTLRVPSSTLKLYQREAELAWLAENHMEVMPRGQKKNLFEQIEHDLRARMVPTIKAVDVVWNTTSRQVWIWTQNGKVLDEIDEIFKKTFEVGLLPRDPYSLAEAELDGAMKEALERAEPAPFVDIDTLLGGQR